MVICNKLTHAEIRSVKVGASVETSLAMTPLQAGVWRLLALHSEKHIAMRSRPQTALYLRVNVKPCKRRGFGQVMSLMTQLFIPGICRQLFLNCVSGHF